MLARCVFALAAAMLACSASPAQILATPPAGSGNSFVSPSPATSGTLLALPSNYPVTYNTYVRMPTIKGISEPNYIHPSTIRTRGFIGNPHLAGFEATPLPVPSGPGITRTVIVPSAITPSSVAPSAITPSSITPSRLNIRR